MMNEEYNVELDNPINCETNERKRKRYRECNDNIFYEIKRQKLDANYKKDSNIGTIDDFSCCNLTTHSKADMKTFESLPSINMIHGITNKSTQTIIDQCIHGLSHDMKPILASDGEGGTYFLRDMDNKKIVCFKPSDEEVGCINNPRGRTDPVTCGIKIIKPGDGYKREIAAYLLDNTHFHDVPPTIGIECAYNGFHYNYGVFNMKIMKYKIGSLQKFVSGEVSDNFGEKNFSTRSVHRIGILDIRLLNIDRNSGNILVSRDQNGRYKLIPIDHGLTFPEKMEIIPNSWVWLNWKQSKQPFDPYTIAFINNIDIDKDIQILCDEFDFPETVYENMRIAHLVLIKFANMGLTLYDIGNIMTRADFDTPSILEELMIKAEELAMTKVINENDKTVVRKWYYYCLDELLRIECEQLIQSHKENNYENDLYDLDTINGSFIWKNDLRMQWIKSRIARKKAMQKLSNKLPINPFNGYTFSR